MNILFDIQNLSFDFILQPPTFSLYTQPSHWHLLYKSWANKTSSLQMVTAKTRHQMSPKLLSDTKQTTCLQQKRGNVRFLPLATSFFYVQSVTSTKSNWVQIILWKANIIYPALKINRGKSSEMCVNLISCAWGELNETVDGSAAEGDGAVREPGTASWRGYNLEGGADGRPTIKQLL